MRSFFLPESQPPMRAMMAEISPLSMRFKFAHMRVIGIFWFFGTFGTEKEAEQNEFL